jgi:hypothetical protein
MTSPAYEVNVSRTVARDAIDWLEPEGAPTSVLAFFSDLMTALDNAQADADDEEGPAAVTITVGA